MEDTVPLKPRFAWLKRHTFWPIFLSCWALAYAIDYFLLGHAVQKAVLGWMWAWVHSPAFTWGRVAPFLLLPVFVLFLAFVNLYLKISTGAPDLVGRLRPGAFKGLPFAIYFGVYFLLSALFFLLYYWPKLMLPDPKAPQNWFVAVVFSALVGIGLANADLKFGGFNLQPLSQFLSALEAVVEASISRDVTAQRIATNAALRDSLVENVADNKLQAECILLGLTQAELANLVATAKGDTNILKGLMAAEIIKRSEPDARRLIEEALPAWQRRSSGRGF
jgi:hypothetical protein